MSAVESRLAATLAKHSLEDYSWSPPPAESWVWCACGVAITADGSPAQLHAAHVAAVMASSADLAVISLPDSDEHNFAAEVKPGELVWCRYIDRTDSVASVIMRADGAIQAYMSGVRNPDEAEWAAGALLAAAKAAEAVTRDGE